MIEEFRSESSSPQSVRWTEPGDSRGEYYESEIDLAHYWALIVKGKAIIIGCVLLGLFGAIVMSLLSKPVYRARTTLVVEREKNNPYNIAEQSKLYASNDPEFLPTQTKLLTSREIAARVVQRLHLDQRPEVAEQKPALMQAIKFWEKLNLVPMDRHPLHSPPEKWLLQGLPPGLMFETAGPSSS